MRRLFLAFAAVALAGPAAAQLTWVKPGQVQCSAAAGQTLDHDLQPLQPGQDVRVRVRMAKDNFDPKSTTAAVLGFGGMEDHTSIFVGLAANDRTKIFVVLQKGGEEQLIGRYDSNTGDWIDFRLKLDASGLIKVRGDARSGELKLKSAAPPTMWLHCQSGEFDIEISPESYIPAPEVTAPER
jgi:hypothetical protein